MTRILKTEGEQRKYQNASYYVSYKTCLLRMHRFVHAHWAIRYMLTPADRTVKKV